VCKEYRETVKHYPFKTLGILKPFESTVHLSVNPVFRGAPRSPYFEQYDWLEPVVDGPRYDRIEILEGIALRQFLWDLYL